MSLHMNAALADEYVVDPPYDAEPDPAKIERPESRSLNHLAPELRAVHMRLERWGQYTRERAPNGWPAATILARVIEQGTLGASQPGRLPTTIPGDVAETDAAVARCIQIDRRVLKAYYGPWQPPSVLARRCGMRVRQFHNVLRRARWRVWGFLDALEYLKSSKT